MKTYDFIVIGSGGGLKFAMAAAAEGHRVALIEASKLGGTCLNRGCIPSKLMIYPADVLELFHRAKKLNIKGGTPGRIDFSELMTRVNQTTDRISDSIGSHLNQNDAIDRYAGFGTFTGPHIVEVHGEVVTAPRILVATGSTPLIPSITGLSDVPYMTSEEALRQRTRPDRMIIIGAGYIATELGHAYGSFGCETHFVVRSNLLRHEDQQIQTLFRDEFGKRHHIHRPYTPLSVRYDAGEGLFTMVLQHVTEKTTKEITADALLVATGVVPQTAGLQLDRAGIQCNPSGYISVNERFETTTEGIYAVGDCVGNYLFRHSVNREVDYLIESLLHGSDAPFSYGPMPHAVFTVPEIAGAGMTEQQAQQELADFVVGYAELADSNMGMARQLDYGFCKLIVDAENQTIAGVQMIGEDVSTLVQIPLTVMYHGGTVEDLLDVVYIHPAYPEVIRDAARDAVKKLKNCKQ
ncbi:MAG: dihydrolipoyl dehydrogenase [Spartobacteria bacterium]|nr:dihydrolipoyl dehydrogenase [Spartobacteria bacterium]